MVLGQYYSHEAHKPCLWPRDMAINEHQDQLAESSIEMRLYALVLMLCPHFSKRAAASPARGGGAD